MMTTSNATLHGLSGHYADSSLDLDDQPLTIGRDPDRANLVYPSQIDLVSGCHCQLLWDPGEGGIVLEDLHATNGTFFANSASLDTEGGGWTKLAPGQRTVLESGDRFYLGDMEEMFEVRFDASPCPPSPSDAEDGEKEHEDDGEAEEDSYEEFRNVPIEELQLRLAEVDKRYKKAERKGNEIEAMLLAGEALKLSTHLQKYFEEGGDSGLDPLAYFQEQQEKSGVEEQDGAHRVGYAIGASISFGLIGLLVGWIFDGAAAGLIVGAVLGLLLGIFFPIKKG